MQLEEVSRLILPIYYQLEIIINLAFILIKGIKNYIKIYILMLLI
jgi:hypothetical protein